MSSSPRLTVLLVSASVFLGTIIPRAYAAELVLSSDFLHPGLTFHTNIPAIPSPTPPDLTEFTFDEKPEGFTLTTIPDTTSEKTLENIVLPIPSTLPTPTPTIPDIKSSPTPTPEVTETPSPTPTLPVITEAPTPTPQPEPIVAPEYLNAYFQRYSEEYHVDKELLKKIAKCESSFGTGASYLDYGGMFQFSTSSWISTRTAMGQDTNPDLRYNGEESIKTAAFKISREGVSAWPNCH